MPETDIVIRGAREHNLQSVSLRLPRNKLIVMTGVSGSGKSSLAFDTLYAEGQRRYVESLSSYARQFLGQMPKPEVDSITGLSPSISIQQKSSGRNPRSTVGTITEIYDYLRVLFARVGQGICPQCDRPITAQTREQILESLLKLPEGTRFLVLAPVVQRQKGEYRDLFDDLLKQGYLRARVDGRLVQLTENLQLDRQMRHTIDIVIDRLQAGAAGRTRLAEAVEAALRLGKGSLIVAVESGERKAESGKRGRRPADGDVEMATANADAAAAPATPGFVDRLYSSRYSCTHCGISYEPPSPQLFSFNSPQGMCPECNGLAVRHDFDHSLLIPDEKLSLAKGAVELLGKFRDLGRWRRHIYDGVATTIEREHGLNEGTLLVTPWKDLSEPIRDQLLYGTGDRNITFSWRHRGGVWKHGGTYAGVIPELLESYRKAKNPMRRRQLERYMTILPCKQCHGTRLNPQARSVRIVSQVTAPPPKSDAQEGRSTRGKGVPPWSLTLPGTCALTIAEAAQFFERLELDATGQLIAEEILKEIRGRLGFLLRCGLDYLSLERAAPTLSGGETQRIRLAGQIGCGLVGVVYILDEPSIGLHPRDNDKLLDSLLQLRDQGNTVIVVEHDEDTMRAADHLIDFGPGPGVRGGKVVAEGTLDDLYRAPHSLTGQFLSGVTRIAVPELRRPESKTKLTIVGAAHNNLRGVDVSIPLERFVCVTGVSGSGKSSLVNDILWEALNRDLNEGKGTPGRYKRLDGLKHLDKAIDIDQSPIGRTPRSNPATYVKLFDLIRDLYTQLPDSKLRGYKPGRFSFNVASGRCEACEGNGSTKLEMDFLADIWVTCPVCSGHRFNHETLEVKFKGTSIADVLEMDVQQALLHFENVPRIKALLQTLHDVGLDYLKLGQPSPTLSGGEAQRIKLARELGKRATGRTIYLLDEPTTGLHFADVQKLLEVLQGLVALGNTVLVVEHNQDVIKTADWVIDLGPEGGAGGGALVAEGTPETIAACAQSHTGRALAKVLRAAALPLRKGGQGRSRGGKVVSPRNGTPRQSISNSGANGVLQPIVVKGASQHNLQNVDLVLPRHSLSVFCGPSGSGKSSLAMDTLYAEGQRRYVESLSAYARQFLGQMPKPRVEHVSGLSPAIAIEQKTVGNTPRSTVGTVTEIYDYLRILFARLGRSWCPECNEPVESQTTDEVIEKILKLPEGTRILLLAPQEVAVGNSYERLWERLQSQGFRRVRVDGATHAIDQVPEFDRRRKHDVEIVVDRLTVSRSARGRIAESVEAALDLGRGWLHVARVDDQRTEPDWLVDRFSLHKACTGCGRSFDDLSPNNFSFNSSLGWCPACEGLGIQQGTNLAALIADPKRTLAGGAIAAWPDFAKNATFRTILEALSREFRLPLDVPFEKLDGRHQRVVLYGTGEKWVTLAESGVRLQYKGLYPAVEEATRVAFAYRMKLDHMAGEVPCSVCHGSRLRDDAAAVQFTERTLQQICVLPLGECLAFFRGIKLAAADRKVAGDLLREVVARMSFLVDVGLHYLTLSRTMPTLSGGESQRIRLAGQVGRALTGVLYVLDEPTIGLHPRDNGRLLRALRQLRDLGNTVILVEHDREVLQAADRLYDFGPGAGRFGGTIVDSGSPRELAKRGKSLTGKYLGGEEEIPIPNKRRMEPAKLPQPSLPQGAQGSLPPGGGWLEIRGARHHNLRDVDLRIPLGTLTCISGVSGSGKSSLIEETLAKAVARRLHNARDLPGAFDELLGIEQINKIICVDQQPLGSTPASNPATYTGVFEDIRELYARLPESKIRGYRPGRFSFNRAGGRCEACEGNGQKCIEMHFLPDVWVECDECHGRRFNPETLAVQYKGQSIADVLEMSIGQAHELFGNIPAIRAVLATLCAVGLDYLTLGQSAATLSGGEAQRVKLAAELARPQTGRTLYILDEPTTGLHFDDIRKLLKVLHSLVKMGNTVVVIEHNLDVMKTADWIIDLGPEAGDEGGRIVAEGTPEDVAEAAGPRVTNGVAKSEEAPISHTAKLLKPILARGTRRDVEIFDAHEVARKQKGDLDLRKVGRDTRMPWQVNGRAWHCVDRVGHNGRPCRWEGSALTLVVDRIEQESVLAPINWNDRSLVEVKSAEGAGSWFLHALTGDEWLLSLKFRVGRNTFNEDALRQELQLKPLDDLDELPVYGRADRVRVKNLKGPWQEVTLVVHWLREIDTPVFRGFLDRAIRSYLDRAGVQPLDLAELTPWKVLGRKWHISRKGFPSGKRVAWEPGVLEKLFELLQTTIPAGLFDWSNKQVVYFQTPDVATFRAAIHTKRRGGVDLLLLCPAGRVALGQISQLGDEREISPATAGSEQIKIRFHDSEQLRAPELQRLLGDASGR
ncbi:MAG: excinuclease ABC subunit UvrA [Planctomycetaceae bacterium]|nr:excinuclease ABC subunit UvrA [Planctomycetaceae bacterium]